ncbi:hypothetical protein [Chitinophaga barathri]|uniref:Uncharacterized protein n=1 Tax=Chitinophaga barathri TaxID=1647451 RepID=A0A3N4ME42_9BACT|nr:hypothetical protein [Chitinophaga barathri]RPD40256.1 hypothetical protein EG028_16555 [Chitinophaga barathri]
MNIENDLRQLSLRLAELGLEQVVAERSAANESFRVVYVNKNAKVQQAPEPQTPRKGNNNKTSSKL